MLNALIQCCVLFVALKYIAISERDTVLQLLYDLLKLYHIISKLNMIEFDLREYSMVGCYLVDADLALT